MPSACPAPLAKPKAAAGLAQQSSWLCLRPLPWGRLCRHLPTTPSAGPEYLLLGPGQLRLTHPDPLPGDAAVMDAVSPDMPRAISSETVPVTTAQQTPSFKGYWLKQWDVWSSPSLLTEVKSARSIEFRQLIPSLHTSFICNLFGSPEDAARGGPVRVGELIGLHAVLQDLVDTQCKTSHLVTRPHLTG